MGNLLVKKNKCKRGKPEGCGTAMMKDLEALVLEFQKNRVFLRREILLDAIPDVVGFYETLKFRKNGQLNNDGLQPMIKEILPGKCVF